MIVKVQVSLASSLNSQQILIYNKSRSVMTQQDASEEIIKLMDGCFKAFFHAHIDDKMIILDKEAKWQSW